MDKEALRKQLYEEIQSQFDAKLREAKRQKSQLEEELELASEKWRTERRRLNAEIDRLEAALGDARQTGRKTPGVKPGPPSADPQQIARLQAAAEEKIKKAAKDWEGERTRLQAEVSRLQSGIAELIERSNNPLRSNQVEREKLEAKYDEALRARRQAENALLAAKTEWEEEKLKLVGETMKLRRSPNSPLKSSSDPQLETLVADLDKARHEVSKLKDSHSIELRDINTQLERSRMDAKDLADRLDGMRKLAEKERGDLEKQLRETVETRTKLERELERARQAPPPSIDGSRSEEVAQLKQELEDARAALLNHADDSDNAAAESRAAARLKGELDDAQEEIKRLERRLAEARESAGSEDVDAVRQQYEEQINQLREQLHNAVTAHEAAAALHTSSNGHSSTGLDVATIDAEVARVEGMIATIAKLIDDPDTELSTVIRKNVERAELDAYLKGILFSLGRGKGLSS